MTRARVGKAKAIGEAFRLQPRYSRRWRKTQYEVHALEDDKRHFADRDDFPNVQDNASVCRRGLRSVGAIFRAGRHPAADC
jgi:hypothetical protein